MVFVGVVVLFFFQCKFRLCFKKNRMLHFHDKGNKGLGKHAVEILHGQLHYQCTV